MVVSGTCKGALRTEKTPARARPEVVKTWVGAPTLFQHVPQDTAGPGPVVPAHPSGPSRLSGLGHLAPPAQGRRRRCGCGCQAQDPFSTPQRDGPPTGSHPILLQPPTQPPPALAPLLLAPLLSTCSLPSLHVRSGHLSLLGVQETPGKRNNMRSEVRSCSMFLSVPFPSVTAPASMPGWGTNWAHSSS